MGIYKACMYSSDEHGPGLSRASWVFLSHQVVCVCVCLLFTLRVCVLAVCIFTKTGSAWRCVCVVSGTTYTLASRAGFCGLFISVSAFHYMFQMCTCMCTRPSALYALSKRISVLFVVNDNGSRLGAPEGTHINNIFIAIPPPSALFHTCVSHDAGASASAVLPFVKPSMASKSWRETRPSPSISAVSRSTCRSSSVISPYPSVSKMLRSVSEST